LYTRFFACPTNDEGRGEIENIRGIKPGLLNAVRVPVHISVRKISLSIFLSLFFFFSFIFLMPTTTITTNEGTRNEAV
jgi:hypothetical protein